MRRLVVLAGGRKMLLGLTRTFSNLAARSSTLVGQSAFAPPRYARATDAPTPRANSPSRPPSATGSSPCRPPRQPQRPTQTAPAAQLALAEHLHHRPGTHPQPAPTHLSGAQRPAQRSPTPSATNRTSPAPHSCTPQNAPARTHAPAQRPPGPKPSIPQTRRWIQAKRAGGGGSLPPLTSRLHSSTMSCAALRNSGGPRRARADFDGAPRHRERECRLVVLAGGRKSVGIRFRTCR